MSRKNMLAIISTAMALSAGHSALFRGSENEYTLYIPKEKMPPSGSKTYFFNLAGEFSISQMLKDECVFKCFAINDKNAKRKFKKWLSSNNQI